MNHTNRISLTRALSTAMFTLFLVGLGSGTASAETFRPMNPNTSMVKDSCKNIREYVEQCRAYLKGLSASEDPRVVEETAQDCELGQKQLDLCHQGVPEACLDAKTNYEECREEEAERLKAPIDSKEVVYACRVLKPFYDSCESDSQGKTTCATEKVFWDNGVRNNGPGEAGYNAHLYDWCIGDRRCPKEKSAADQCLADAQPFTPKDAKSVTPYEACAKQLQGYDACIGNKPASCVKLDRAYQGCTIKYGDKSCTKQHASLLSCYDNYEQIK